MKIRNFNLALCLSALMFSSSAFAAYTAAAKGGWLGLKEDLTSPYTTEARPYFLTGLGLTTILTIDREHLSDPVEKRIAQDKPLGASAKYGDWAGHAWPNLIYIGGAFAYGYYYQSDLGFHRAKMMALATAYSGVMAQVIKNIARESRPNDRSDKQSFPSGHATTAFAFASVIGASHGAYWGVPAYSLAAFVGYSRMNDNKHYLHDVFAGATLGIGYGLGIYYQMKSQSEYSIYDTNSKFHMEQVLLLPNSENGESLNLIADF